MSSVGEGISPNTVIATTINIVLGPKIRNPNYKSYVEFLFESGNIRVINRQHFETLPPDVGMLLYFILYVHCIGKFRCVNIYF